MPNDITVVEVFSSREDGSIQLGRLVGGKRYLVAHIPPSATDAELGSEITTVAAQGDHELALPDRLWSKATASRGLDNFWENHSFLLVECGVTDYAVVAMERNQVPGMAFTSKAPGAVVELTSPTPEQLGAAVRKTTGAAK